MFDTEQMDVRYTVVPDAFDERLNGVPVGPEHPGDEHPGDEDNPPVPDPSTDPQIAPRQYRGGQNHPAWLEEILDVSDHRPVVNVV